MNIILKMLLPVITLLVFSTAYPQDSVKTYSHDSEKTVVLSKKTGELIDKIENKKYEVFPDMDNLDSVRILWSPEKQYFIRISMHNKNLSKEIQINEENLIRLTERIELKDVIDKGIFKPCLSEISIDTSVNEMHVNLKNDYFSVLPWAKDNKTRYNFHPSFGFGAGIKYLDMDLSPAKGCYDFVEQTVRDHNYSIGSNDFDNGTKEFYTLNLYFYLFESFGLYFEAGKGIGTNWDTYYTSGSIKYHINIKNLNWVKPYIGAGYTKVGFEGLHVYSARISGIYPNGSYQFLQEISTEINSYGLTLNGGAEAGLFDYHNHFYFTLYVDVSYAFFNEKTIDNTFAVEGVNYNYTGKVKFPGLILTSGIKIYL